MSARVDDLQARIQAAKDHRDDLQHRRSVLASRSATATSCLCVLRETFNDVCRAARPPISPAADPSRLFRPPPDPLQPLSAFAAHALLTLTAVLDAMNADGAAAPDGFARSVEQAKRITAAHLDLPPQSVCWHIQSEYDVADGSPLSFSSTLSSLECIASIQLQRHAVLLEMALLHATQQHSNMRPPSVSPLAKPPPSSPAAAACHLVITNATVTALPPSRRWPLCGLLRSATLPPTLSRSQSSHSDIRPSQICQILTYSCTTHAAWSQSRASASLHFFSESPRSTAGFQGSHNLDEQDPGADQTQPWPLQPPDDAALFPPSIPPAAVETLRARCGVRDSVPLTSAVEYIFRKLLRTYLPRLPFNAWRAACTKMLRLLHTHYGEPLHAGLPAALQPTPAGGSAAVDSADDGLHHLLQAIAQLTAATLCAELQASEAVRCSRADRHSHVHLAATRCHHLHDNAVTGTAVATLTGWVGCQLTACCAVR